MLFGVDSKDLLEYAKLMLPIVLAQFIVPPLSYFNGSEEFPELLAFLYSLSPISRDYAVSLMLGPPSRRRLHQYLTYMFVHGDLRHLLNNIISSMELGLPVFLECGAALPLCALAGGVCAALPLASLERGQSESLARQWAALAQSPLAQSPLTSALSGTAEFIARNSISQLYAISNSCGFSGAVFALLGANMCFTGKDLYFAFSALWVKITRKRRSSFATNTNEILKELGSELGRWGGVFLKSLHFAKMSLCILTELKCVLPSPSLMSSSSSSQSLASSLNKFLANLLDNFSEKQSDGFLAEAGKLMEKTKQSHTAHIQGFAAGVIFAFIAGLAIPALRRCEYTKHLFSTQKRKR